MGRKKEITTLNESLIEKNTSHFADEEAAARQHDKVQEDISKLDPARQKQVRSMQAEVQSNIDEMNDLCFSEEAFASDRRISRATPLEKAAGRYAVGKIFAYEGINYIKTPFETVVPAQTYVDVLQDNVIGVTNELTKLQNAHKTTTFFGFIKLAFKSLGRK